MEKSVKERRLLVLVCVVFGISSVFAVKLLSVGFNSANGFGTSILLKTFPFVMIAISMVIYAIGLLRK